jgi:NAD(P)H-dependent flavin oxidoreductase YrpB (nitropropane dioxygenase family)
LQDNSTFAFQTEFTRRFGLAVPIVQAPMGGAAGPKLVAAAANAGALAILPIWFGTPAAAAEVIDKTSNLTSRPFAVNLRADLNQDDLIAAALDAGILTFHLFWGDPASSMPAIRRAGARMMVTVSDLDTTKAALDAGADALIAQGMEAGGHVFGATPLAELIPSVVEAAAGVPVAAAGGIVDGADVATAFKLGATAAVLGTRLVVTDESDAHPDYVEALLEADDGDTVLSKCFDGFWPNAPHRTLKNSTYRAWSEAGFPGAGRRPGEGDILMRSPVGMDIPRYHAATPTNRMSGDCEAMALYAGEGVGRIKSIRSTQSVIDEIVMDAAARLTKTRGV